MLNLNPTVLEMVSGLEHRERVRNAERRRVIDERVHAPSAFSQGFGQIKAVFTGLRNPEVR